MPTDSDEWKSITNCRRIVVKIGTKSLLLDDKSFDYKVIASLVQDIKELMKNRGKEVVLVSSGAVSAGMKKLGMEHRPRDLVMQQVAASVGNPLLINEYTRMFDDVPVAQILLTQNDLSNRKSYVHFSNTMERLLKEKIVPIVNENDVISIDELIDTKSGESDKDYNFSDNDVLSALVAASISADLLVVLSDVDGLYTKHPNAKDAKFIDRVDEINADIWKLGHEGGKVGRGGMATKLKAAEISSKSGIWMIIAHAKRTSLMKLINEGGKCTVFKPEIKMPDKKLWMIFAANVSGKITLDDGAIKALHEGASLLLPGIKDCSGTFHKDDVIEFWDEKQAKLIGKGITNHSSQEISRYLELYKQDPRSYKAQNIGEIIHRDKFTLIM
ncbi:MAG: glutamate 5-kinase [Candidatus Hodarchaeota archaeon]